jgi:two-component system OmpR family response regulator
LSFNNGELLWTAAHTGCRGRAEEIALTPTEFKVLFTMASSPERVFTRSELVEKALGIGLRAMKGASTPM